MEILGMKELEQEIETITYSIEETTKGTNYIVSDDYEDFKQAKNRFDTLYNDSINNKRFFINQTISLNMYNEEIERNDILYSMEFNDIGEIINTYSIEDIKE